MDIVRADELASRLEELMERVGNDERIIVSHDGRQVALVSFDDLAFLEGVDHDLDQRDAEEARRRLSDPAQSPVIFSPTHTSQQPSNTT
jgi:hypothetical protein